MVAASRCVRPQFQWYQLAYATKWIQVHDSIEGLSQKIVSITLHYITLRYVTLRHVTLRYVTLRYVTLRYITLHYVTLHYVTLHYITLRYVTLHYITLHYCLWYHLHDISFMSQKLSKFNCICRDVFAMSYYHYTTITIIWERRLFHASLSQFFCVKLGWGIFLYANYTSRIAIHSQYIYLKQLSVR